MRGIALPLWIAAAILWSACGSSADEPAVAGDPCSQHLAPGSNDQLDVQSALLGAAPGSVLCFAEGVYELSDGLSLSTPGVALRAEEGPVVFDFSGQNARAPGLDVSGDDVIVEGISFRHAKGPGLRVVGADNVRLRGIEAIGAGRRIPEGGGLALQGVSNVLVDSCEIRGVNEGISLADALQVVVSNCTVRGNQVGLVARGASGLEIVGNTFRSNDDGIHLLAAGEIPSERVKVHDNLIEHSRTRRGAGKLGAGLVIAGASQVEVHNNLLRRNDGAGVVLGSERVLAFLGLEDAPESAEIFVHDNHLERNGRRPIVLEEAGADLLVEGDWDASACLLNNPGSFLSLDGQPFTPAESCSEATVPSISL